MKALLTSPPLFLTAAFLYAIAASLCGLVQAKHLRDSYMSNRHPNPKLIDNMEAGVFALFLLAAIHAALFIVTFIGTSLF